jgi:electron transfer flavoprotein alpha subunit
MTNTTGILILGEMDDGSLSSMSKELLDAGHALARDLGQELSIALASDDPSGPANEAIAHGADRVYTMSSPLLAEYQVDLHLEAMTQLCHKAQPSIILSGKTPAGQDLAPRLAVRLGVGLAQDCLDVSIGGGRMIAKRPIQGGNAIAAVACTATPQMAAIRPKAYEPLEADPSRQGEVTPVDADLFPSMARVKLVEIVREEARGVQLETAKIVVAGGRGLGGPEPFKDLEVVAGILKAGLGASRAPVDAGWVPPSYQIGLTGKTITPDLYITVAISGASQHMAGCSGIKTIIAINKDANANIFKEARYGVVGPWEKVLPSFTEALRELVE